jgi:hypothetical protein
MCSSFTNHHHSLLQPSRSLISPPYSMSSTERGSSPSPVPAIASHTPNFQPSLPSAFSSLNSPVSYTNHPPAHLSFANQQSSQHPYNMSNLTSLARIATPFESNNTYHDFRVSASNTPSTPSTLLSPIIDMNSNALLQDFDTSSQIYGPQSREMQQARLIVSWLHFSNNTRPH